MFGFVRFQPRRLLLFVVTDLYILLGIRMSLKKEIGSKYEKIMLKHRSVFTTPSNSYDEELFEKIVNG